MCPQGIPKSITVARNFVKSFLSPQGSSKKWSFVKTNIAVFFRSINKSRKTRTSVYHNWPNGKIGVFILLEFLSVREKTAVSKKNFILKEF